MECSACASVQSGFMTNDDREIAHVTSLNPRQGLQERLTKVGYYSSFMDRRHKDYISYSFNNSKTFLH